MFPEQTPLAGAAVGPSQIISAVEEKNATKCEAVAKMLEMSRDGETEGRASGTEEGGRGQLG